MITSEMRNIILRDQILESVANIQKELEQIKTEVATLKQLLGH